MPQSNFKSNLDSIFLILFIVSGKNVLEHNALYYLLV